MKKVALLVLVACGGPKPQPVAPVVAAPSPSAPVVAEPPVEPRPRPTLPELVEEPLVEAPPPVDPRSASRNGFGVIGTGRYGRSVELPREGKPLPRRDGESDKDVIRRFIRSYLSTIHRCHDEALKTQPRLAGTVNVEVMIEANGHVSKAVGSGMPDIEDCVARAVDRITFPTLARRTLVHYPFTFRAPPP